MTSTTNLQKSLLNWFSKNQRNLPWRHTYDPYQIWISEIMLQQTQMDRVAIFFLRWMKEFPDLQTLAESTEDKVLKCWEGLGYYSRARNILKAAKLILRRHDGQIPDSRRLLLALPGIGPYTAGAIASISFNRNVPLVDANIERIFARLFNIELIPKTSAANKLNWQKAEELVPSGEARNFNQALMELGALICRPKNPNCDTCPLSFYCLALKYGVIPERPVPQKGQKTIPIEMATGLLLHNDLIFIQQRLEDDVWGSLWEFPGGRLEEGEKPEETIVREFMEETEFKVQVESKITTTIHHYTRYKVTLHCFQVNLAQVDSNPVLHAAQEYHWVPFESLNNYAFPAGHRKLISFLEESGLFRHKPSGKPN